MAKAFLPKVEFRISVWALIFTSPAENYVEGCREEDLQTDMR